MDRVCVAHMHVTTEVGYCRMRSIAGDTDFNVIHAIQIDARMGSMDVLATWHLLVTAPSV